MQVWYPMLARRVPGSHQGTVSTALQLGDVANILTPDLVAGPLRSGDYILGAVSPFGEET